MLDSADNYSFTMSEGTVHFEGESLRDSAFRCQRFNDRSLALTSLSDVDIPFCLKERYHTLLTETLLQPHKIPAGAVLKRDPDTITRWFRESFLSAFLIGKDNLNESQKMNLDDFLLLSQELDAIRENNLTDWTVDRGEDESKESLGGTGTLKILDVLSQWTSHVYMDKGGGDNGHISWVASQRPEWEYYSVGDYLYFSLGKVLQRFVLPEAQKNKDVDVFMSLLSVFLMEELKSDEYWDVYRANDEFRCRNINDTFLLLADISCWLNDHFDLEAGIYVASKEFESDCLARLDESGKGVFDLFKELAVLLNEKGKSDDEMDLKLLGFYKKIFQPEFCEEIERFLFNGRKLKRERVVDLRRKLPVETKGFIQAKFTDIPALFPETRLGYVRSLRSDSHEDDVEYEEDLAGVLTRLDMGGVIHTDGHRASYSRIDRTDIILRLLNQYPVGEFNAYVVIRKDAEMHDMATSVWIQRAKGGEFLPPDQLAQCIDMERYRVVPLAEYANQFIVRFEAEVRRLMYKVFLEVHHGDAWMAKQQFAHTSVSDCINDLKESLLKNPPRVSSICEVVEVFRSYITKEARVLANLTVPKKRVSPIYSSPYSPETYKNGPTLRLITRNLKQ